MKNPVGILLDTQGPEIRTGDTSEVVNLEPGELVSFTIRDEADVETTSIRVHYDELIQSVDVGTLISLDNGLLNFKVLNKTKNQLECQVLDGEDPERDYELVLECVRQDLEGVEV